MAVHRVPRKPGHEAKDAQKWKDSLAAATQTMAILLKAFRREAKSIRIATTEKVRKRGGNQVKEPPTGIAFSGGGGAG